MLFGTKMIPAGHLHIVTGCTQRCWAWELQISEAKNQCHIGHCTAFARHVFKKNIASKAEQISCHKHCTSCCTPPSGQMYSVVRTHTSCLKHSQHLVLDCIKILSLHLRVWKYWAKEYSIIKKLVRCEDKTVFFYWIHCLRTVELAPWERDVLRQWLCLHCYDIIPLESSQQTYEVMQQAGVLHTAHKLSTPLKKLLLDKSICSRITKSKFRDLPTMDL